MLIREKAHMFQGNEKAGIKNLQWLHQTVFVLSYSEIVASWLHAASVLRNANSYFCFS